MAGIVSDFDLNRFDRYVVAPATFFSSGEASSPNSEQDPFDGSRVALISESGHFSSISAVNGAVSEF